MFDTNLDYLTIIAGTTNEFTAVYREAAENVSVDTNKGIKILTNFLNNIEQLNSKDVVKDTRISSSKGNVKNFSGYENIKTSISFLSKNFNDAPDVKDCIKLFDGLEKFEPQYSKAYDKKVRLVVLEYENALYMLVTALSSIIANRMEVVTNGSEIRIKKSGVNRASYIEKTLRELANKIGDRNHGDYLDALIEESHTASLTPVKESFEDIVGAVKGTVGMVVNVFKKGGSLAKKGVNIFKTSKNTLFGMVPLIRSVLYLRYKKKADTIISLEQQVVFIKANIDRLQNKEMDAKKKEAIIKKQKAICDRYMKKAAKLRAQLVETEKEASSESKKDEKKIANVDDDFILEDGISVKEIFEATSVQQKRMEALAKK